MPIHDLDRSHLCRRYKFTGTLVLDTALHIGGGREASTVTDGPIVRNGMGFPFIPGSSFKGAFRAGVERLLPNLLNYKTCQLSKDSMKCISVDKELATAYRRVSEAVARGMKLGEGNYETAQEDRKALARLDRDAWAGRELTSDNLLNLLDGYLCDTCKTFGSSHLASVAHFHDLPIHESGFATTQIRDGVGIDRDSERAIDQIKFDFEVVPAQIRFAFSLTLENPSKRDLRLIALGLQEFSQGMIPLGGIRSRGLGRCHLSEVKVAFLDFTNPEGFRAFLGGSKMPFNPADDFIAEQMTMLSRPFDDKGTASKGDQDAQTACQ